MQQAWLYRGDQSIQDAPTVFVGGRRHSIHNWVAQLGCAVPLQTRAPDSRRTRGPATQYPCFSASCPVVAKRVAATPTEARRGKGLPDTSQEEDAKRKHMKWMPARGPPWERRRAFSEGDNQGHTVDCDHALVWWQRVANRIAVGLVPECPIDPIEVHLLPNHPRRWMETSNLQDFY